jgi:hypothetical protein
LEIYRWKNSKLSEVEGSVQGFTDDFSRVTKRDGATVAEASLQAAAVAKDQEAVAHEAAALEAEVTSHSTVAAEVEASDGAATMQAEDSAPQGHVPRSHALQSYAPRPSESAAVVGVSSTVRVLAWLEEDAVDTDVGDQAVEAVVPGTGAGRAMGGNLVRPFPCGPPY